MRYEDASGSFSGQDAGVTDARDDADALPAGSRGPATGNTITGEGTITGAAGADIVDNGPGKIVALEGASGSDTAEGGSLHVEGRFGEITMDSRGGYSYTPHAAKPEGGSDVFRYTLADAEGKRDTATLTIDIGREIEKIDANAQQLVPGPDGVITLPPGVELSDIMVVGRNLVINLPDGTQMVIIDGAVFVPQLVINGVEVPATNLASLLIDAEPQPAAGTPTSSGGNFAVDVPPLDPGVPLGDLIPPTELVFEPPIFEDVGQFEDDEPEIFVQPDGQPASVAAVDSVNEAGLPTRNGGEPAGSGESADGNSSDNDDSSETTTGVILIDAQDDPAVVTINGTAVTSVGQIIAGAHGNLTITSISDTVIGYSYTLTDNTFGNDTQDDFSVTVTDNDGDQATATLTIDIIDDVPTARNDTDAVTTLLPTTTGNVITSVGTTNSPAGVDTVGADNASLTAVSGAGGSDSSFNEGGNLVVTGSLGTLTINASGSYTYVANADSPGGTDVFTYTLTDGDGDTSNATLSITVPADLRPTLDVPTAGEAGTLVDEAGLPPRTGEPAGSGESADGNPNNESDDSETTNGTITFTPGDTPATVRIDGVVVTGTVGQTFVGDHGVLTITGYNAATGTITYSYTLTDNTSGDNTEDSFAVTVTDSDGDVASGTLVIDIIDDVPTARPDTDVVAAGTFGPATGNVITDASAGDAGDGDNGADTVGADDAVVTSIDNAANATPAQAVPAVGSVVVAGQYGSLTISADGSYSYVRNEGTPGGVTETFNYTITDGDGDTSTSTLTITIEDRGVIVGQNALVRTDDDAVPGAGGNPGGPEDDVDAANLTGTLSGSGGDGALTFDLLTTGAPAGFTYVDGPGGSILVQQVQDGSTVTVLTITVNAATGEYTVTQNAAIEHPSLDGQDGDDTENNVPFTINYTVTDVDGDSAGGTLTIDIDDDTPIALVEVQVGGTVDEDGVVEGAADGGDGDGNPGGVEDVPGESTVVNGNVSALFSSGADQPLTYSLLSDTSGLPALTSNGAPVTYSVVGNTLTASANGGPVFTLVLNADTGDYTFTLLDQLDHPSLDGQPGDDTENPADSDLTIQLGSIIQATDSDGDSVTADANGLNIVVDDDSPLPFEDCPDDVITVNDPTAEPFIGNLNLPPVGADEPGEVTFGVSDGDPVLDTEGNPVTSGEDPLFYFINSDGVLEARVGDETGELIFTITLNGDGTFTYDQIGTIGIGGTISFDSFDEADAGNTNYVGLGNDDPTTAVDLLMSAGANTDGDAALEDATVNTDADSIGSQNQSMDAGDEEVLRIDFVSDLQTGGAGPTGFSFSGHVATNSFLQTVPQVQGSQTEVAAFNVWALNSTLTDAAAPDRDPTDGFSDSTTVMITEVTIIDYETGATHVEDISGLANGATEVLAFGVSVTRNVDGSVTFTGIQEGDQYGIATGANSFNAVAIQAEDHSFDLGIFSIGVANEFEPVDLEVPIVLTDSDGDSVVCDIDIHIGVPLEAPDIAVTVNEAGLPVIGSDAGSDSEIATGDLQSQVSGGTGPYTFTLVGSGNGTFGTLVLNTDGTFTYTLDTPFDSQPDANDGTNPELGAESFTFEATDSLGATQTGTITVNIIDDVPSINVSGDTSVVEGATATGTWSQSIGADQPGATTVVVFGGNEFALGAAIPTGKGTLTVNANGTWSFASNNNLDNDLAQSISFSVKVTDADGDVAIDPHTVTINDGAPPTGGDTLTLEVDDDALSDGNNAASDDEIDAGNLTFTAGSDALTSFVFGNDLSGLGGGLTWVRVDGDTITGSDGGTLIVTLQLTAPASIAAGTSGDVTVTATLANNYDSHPTINVDDLRALGSVTVVASDHDGDSATGTVSVGVSDDVPLNFSPVDLIDQTGAAPAQDNALVNNGAAVATRLLNDANNDGTGENFMGADGFGSLAFSGGEDGDPLLARTGGAQLTADEDPIFLFGFGTGTLTATTDPLNADAAQVVFTVTLNPNTGFGATSTYTIDFNRQIDDGGDFVFDDFSATPAGQNDWIGLDSDVDINGDAIDIDVDNNNSEDLLITPTNAGGSINTSATDIGNANQWIDEGEGVRLDFVVDVHRDGANDEKDVQGYTFDGHYNVTDTGFTIMQTQGGGVSSVRIRAVLDTNDAGAGLKTLNGGTIPIDEDSIEVTGDATYTIVDMGDGTFVITGLAAGAHVEFATVGGAFFNAAEITNAALLPNPATPAPADTFGGDDFALGEFGFSSETQGQPVDMAFEVTATDADGDTSVGTIDVVLVPDDPSAAEALVIRSSVSDTSDTSSLSLMASDSVDSQRTMSAANNNSVLLGAIAAAGLGVSSAAAAEGFGSGGNHMVLDTLSFDYGSAATQGFAIDNREMVRDGLGVEAQEILRAGDNAGESTVQRAIVDKLSLTDPAGEAQAPTALLQATELQAADFAQSTLTSAAVGMPSADMLAGGLANGNVVSVQAQGTAEVGRVLLDALAGGGRGPDLDAVIDAAANQAGGGGAAALDALASQGFLDVSAWHTGGFTGFSATHGSPMMEPMLHHDAVVAA